MLWVVIRVDLRAVIERQQRVPQPVRQLRLLEYNHDPLVRNARECRQEIEQQPEGVVALALPRRLPALSVEVHDVERWVPASQKSSLRSM